VVVGWTRADLRELGFGEMIDEHIRAGRSAPDDWRTRYRAPIVPFEQGQSG
jgi:hypothetical protein